VVDDWSPSRWGKSQIRTTSYEAGRLAAGGWRSGDLGGQQAEVGVFRYPSFWRVASFKHTALLWWWVRG